MMELFMREYFVCLMGMLSSIHSTSCLHELKSSSTTASQPHQTPKLSR